MKAIFQKKKNFDKVQFNLQVFPMNGVKRVSRDFQRGLQELRLIFGTFVCCHEWLLYLENILSPPPSEHNGPISLELLT